MTFISSSPPLVNRWVENRSEVTVSDMVKALENAHNYTSSDLKKLTKSTLIFKVSKILSKVFIQKPAQESSYDKIQAFILKRASKNLKCDFKLELEKLRDKSSDQYAGIQRQINDLFIKIRYDLYEQKVDKEREAASKVKEKVKKTQKQMELEEAERYARSCLNTF